MLAVVAGDVDDGTFAGLNLPPRETVGLTLAVGFHLMLGRVMNAVDAAAEGNAKGCGLASDASTTGSLRGQLQ